MTITKFLEANGAKAWTKFTFAANARGGTVQVHSREASCFCSSGLLSRFLPADATARSRFQQVIDRTDVARWNDADERTFEDVVAAFKKAGL